MSIFLECQKYLFNTGENDLAAVHQAVGSIGANLRPLATRLGLAPGTVDAVMRVYTTGYTLSERMQKILLEWLRRNYDTERHGLPSWRMLCTVVASEEGGFNWRLASEIAYKHPCLPTGIVLFMYFMYSCFIVLYV